MTYNNNTNTNTKNNNKNRFLLIEGGKYSQQHISTCAEKLFHEKTVHSQLFNTNTTTTTTTTTNNNISSVPKFHEQELTLGRVLGRGRFCVVNEITNITLQEVLQGDNDDNNATNNNEKEEEPDMDDSKKDECDNMNNNNYNQRTSAVIVQDRSFMAKYYLRDCDNNNNNNNKKKKKDKKECRYAMKKIQDSCYKDGGILLKAIIDLVVEAHFLSCLGKHPHIIHMRAMSNSTTMYDSTKFFLLLDKLYDTLNQRIHQWKRKQQGGSSLFKKIIMDRNGCKELSLWTERCGHASDLADALAFLHSSNVMYRDIKPENIGFDIRGDIKIFDFGLAKEFDPTTQSRIIQQHNHDDKNSNNTMFYYNLTGDTGSPLYMDPRVALNQPYNELCDVYSFCILLWEILQLETPYKGYNMNLLMKNVYIGGARPVMNNTWPNEIQHILRTGWGNDYTNRPKMITIYETLHNECVRHMDRNSVIAGGAPRRHDSITSLNELEN